MHRINGVTIKNPSDWQISNFKLTKAGRVASGLMTMELIAKKRKFEFEYDVLAGQDLAAIVDLLDSNAVFFTYEYTDDDGSTKVATVYPGEISRKRFRTDAGAWYWKSVSFALIEQ